MSMDLGNTDKVLKSYSAETSPHTTKLKKMKTDESGGKREQLMADRDAYLQLLLTQLKNQNPEKPTDTNQMTQQVIAISQAEQTIALNENMEKLVKMHEDNRNASMVSYIGKEIEYEDGVQHLNFGDAQYKYVLPKDASEIKVSIVDSKGDVVNTYAVDEEMREAGLHVFTWDGKNNRDKRMPEGMYSIKIEARDSYGMPMHADTAIRSKVKGFIDNPMDGTVLVLNDGSRLNLNDVKGVFETEQQEFVAN